LAPAGPMCHRGSAFGPSGPAVRLIACAQVHSAVSGEKMTIAGETLNRVSVTKLHPVIGAEIGGVDLSRTLDNEAMRQIKDAWHQHTVLVFRDQNLSEDDQRRFASYFGRVAKRVPPRPGAAGADTLLEWDDMLLVTDNIDADGKPMGALGHGEMWFHSDKCYHRRPHRASLLYGIEIPTEGRHTPLSR